MGAKMVEFVGFDDVPLYLIQRWIYEPHSERGLQDRGK